MVIISDELVNVLLEAGFNDALMGQFRPFLMDSDWYMLGRTLAYEEDSDEGLN